MAKLTLNNITSGYASTATLNANNDAIEAALENTLSLDGTGPNSMQADFDMNGYAILNQRATSGDANFLWKGAWATGTTYSANNLVYATEGTNLGNGLICIEAHTAGATLDGDYTKWEVYVLKGSVVGGGVVGPVSSTINYLPQWNDVGGTELKVGVPIGSAGGVQPYNTNLNTFAALTTGTASGNVPLIGTTSATEVEAGLSRKSTTLEAEAGIEDTAYMTALKTAQAIAVLADSGITLTAGAAPYYGCRAWINFDGTAIGTFDGGSSTVTRIAASTTATVSCSSPHKLVTGHWVYAASGVAAGSYQVTVTNPTTFTFTTVATTALTSIAITFNVSSIRSSGNVSSVADNGTGNYTINFTAAMPDANYCYTSNVDVSVATLSNTIPFVNEVSRTAGSFQFRTNDAAGSAADSEVINLAFFR